MSNFDVFDPDSDHGAVYRTLVAGPRSTVQALAGRTGLDESEVRGILEDLREADFALALDLPHTTWDATRPDLVAARTLRDYESWRAGVHDAEDRLTEIFRFARHRQTGALDVELLDGREAAFMQIRRMQENVRTELRAIDRPPYYWDEAEILRQEKLQCEQMSDGISYRTIYQESESDSPIRNASMMRTVAAGENARVLAYPPVKITFADDDVAIMAMDPPADQHETLATVVVHRSALLRSLINVFESLWSLAVPVNLAQVNQPLTERERDILTLMASGATDDAIARRLGLSRRTVVRHVSRLLQQLGATTRFQAGTQAVRRGWL